MMFEPTVLILIKVSLDFQIQGIDFGYDPRPHGAKPSKALPRVH